MARFPYAAYAETHFKHGFCDGNATAATREYQRRYPLLWQSNAHVCKGASESVRNTNIHVTTICWQ
jgi:hypothetical protein